MSDTNSTSGSETPSSEEDFYGTGDGEKQDNGLPRSPPGQTRAEPAVQPEAVEGSPDVQEQLPVAPVPAVLDPAMEESTHTNGTIEDAPVDDDDAEDSSSEMDVSVSSRDASPEPSEPSHAGAKRKLSESTDTVDVFEQALEEHMTKKPKLSPSPAVVATRGPSPAERLPTALWQQVFLRLPPAMLCRCLRVSKTFNAYLTQTRAQPVAKKDQKKVRILDSEVIWTEARKNFFPNMPRPLKDRTELSMLQLIGGRTCQFCDRPPVHAPANTPFNAGPGPEGVRVIWPFGIRTCGLCWERNTLKDVEILVTRAGALRNGLAYSFRTPDLHFIPDIQRQLPGSIPSHLRAAKVYYKLEVQDIVKEQEEIQDFGEGAATEWLKGLATKGKDKMADAARWERWEQQVRYGADLVRVIREYDLSSFPRHLEGVQGKSVGVSTTQPPAVMNGTHPLPVPTPGFPPNGYGPPFHTPQLQIYPMPQMPRPMRSIQEVEAARAARKADIERRALALLPPLDPSVLQHIDSFRAALQIPTPLDDAQWEVLKPRLLAGREAAELVEHQKATQLAALQAAIPSTVPDETFLKPAKEVYDRDYEQGQEPLRRRLGEYAHEVINGQWHGGQGLDRDSAPAFAIQVLLHVRKRYLEDKQVGNLPKSNLTRANGSSKRGTPKPDAFLSLDNMKWVYDNKVRTSTDQYRRELFICAGCAEERKPKWFAFEGLIQHYGAKHTSAFSKGNIVVHWQTADWPDEPPFHTNPSPWIKMDRKMAEYKNHGRAHRGTPHQGHQEGPYVPPSPGVNLSENPMFSASPQQQQHPPASNGYHNGSPGYQAYQPQHAGPYGPQRNHSFQAQGPQQPSAEMSYDVQVNKLSTDAHEVWAALEGVKDLLECVRVQTVLHHVVARFTERFHQRPNLDLLTDALATNALMRPVKNAHGLACKLCVAAQTDGSASYQSYFARIRNSKLYNASSLITHFKIVHPPEETLGSLDWAKDMIEIPETQLLGDLVRTPGMDDDKLTLIAAAFPSAFSTPLPKIGLVTEAPPDIGPDSGLANRLLQRLEKKQPQGKKKKGQFANGVNGREGSHDPLPEPGVDEYDPRKPMYAQEPEDPMARFDSDVARKTTGPLLSAASAAPGVSFSLAPETLAALSALTGPPAVGPEREERSPSVGRAEPVSAKSTSTGTNGTSAQAPDISAILASLTGHLQPAQTATPPATVDNRVASAPRPSAHPYGHVQDPPPPPPLAYRPESRRSSGRYAPEPAYRTSASPARYDPQELQAALARNAGHHAQNQQAHGVYSEAPAYAQQPQQQQQQQQQRSPPRYRVVYEDEQQQAYSHAPQAAPVYRREPVQYIQLPEQQQQYQPHPHPQSQAPQQHMQYGYERPKPIYVDEYGRPLELIPIDSAPAPVQYVPHPYEQQQQQQQQQYTRRADPAQPPIPYSYGQVPSAYAAAQPPPQYQPMYAADGRQVYYEQASPVAGATVPGGGIGQAQRYAVYDESARSSIPKG